MCLFPIELSPERDIAIAIFHNFPQVIRFKHGPCSFPGISGIMRNARSHSEIMDRKAPHNMYVDCDMEPCVCRPLVLTAAVSRGWHRAVQTSLLPPSFFSVLITDIEFQKWPGIFVTLPFFSASLDLWSHHSLLSRAASCLSHCLPQTHPPQELVWVGLHLTSGVYCCSLLILSSLSPPKTVCPMFFQHHLQSCPVVLLPGDALTGPRSHDHELPCHLPLACSAGPLSVPGLRSLVFQSP